MQGLCAKKNAIGPRKRLDCRTLQSIADKEFANIETEVDQTGIGPSLQDLDGLRELKVHIGIVLTPEARCVA